MVSSGPPHPKAFAYLVAAALVVSTLGCGASREVRLERRIGELEGDLFDARQRAGDLKARMQRIIARNRVLIGLVEGLTTQPDQAAQSGAKGPLASAHRALEALDRDIELLATTLKRSRKDIQELRGERETLQTNLEDAVGRIEEAKKRESQAQARIDTYRAMLLRLRALIESNDLDLRIVRNQMVVQLPEAVLFDSGQAKLKPEGQKLLVGIAEVLKGIEGRDFQVAGHTDDVPISSWRYRSNWHLSAARAITVARFLIDQGVDRSRLAATGYADTRPITTEKTEEARRRNRRIEIAVMPSLDELPDLTGLDEVARGAEATPDAPSEAATTAPATEAAATDPTAPPTAAPAALPPKAPAATGAEAATPATPAEPPAEAPAPEATPEPPSAPSEPAPSAPAEPSKPAEPAQPAPAEPSKPAEPAPPAPSDPAKPAEPPKPVAPAPDGAP